MSTTQIFSSWEDFFQRPDKGVNGVSAEFAAANPKFAEENETNLGCWNCIGCTGCTDCYGCSNTME